jgi:hypothetical protein
MNNKRMFSIYPNTMGFGFVVLSEKGEIIDYGVVSIHPVSNELCLKRIKEIVSYYRPEILIVEDYEESYKSMRVKKLIAEICHYCKEKLKIFKYSRDEIRNVFDVFGARNKYEISKKISEAYPQLKSKLPEKRRTWEPENYYQGIFDAMSLVLTHYYLFG